MRKTVLCRALVKHHIKPKRKEGSTRASKRKFWNRSQTAATSTPSSSWPSVFSVDNPIPPTPSISELSLLFLLISCFGCSLIFGSLIELNVCVWF
ncbi:hypothetical protein SLEP1_g7304 [Rubroshorea leprosula]|uniref:Uncharacterized protein n=1 Tax=Rubroshorea leprosula TaxID=152421 RepID=A0AAV5I695_9ROSI|nr:hypothetical protein SLEP1_g7304 [Rubroshorea leprosula]